MDATRPRLASHVCGVLLAAALLIALVGLWAGRQPPRADPMHDILRAHIELIRVQREIIDLEIQLDMQLRELEVRRIEL